MLHSPDCHELYLRDWACNYAGCTIVSVDYRLGKVYPVALQDVLDAYYWLTSGSVQVRQVLGFQPTKIVAAGDSAGAFLAYILCLILTDMKEYAAKQQLRNSLFLPQALVSIYGFYNLNLSSPAIAINFLDFLFPAPVLRLGFGSLIKGCDNYAWFSKSFLAYWNFSFLINLFGFYSSSVLS